MDNNKYLLFKDEARAKILEGVEILSKAVSTTLGPRGRNVVIERPGKAPYLTKDGITVCKSINLKDQFSNIGCQMIKEVAQRTVELSGDGTSTATILASSMYKEGLKLLAAGYNPSELKKGMEMATNKVVEILNENAIPVSNNDEIMNVGTVSANGDNEIGKLLAEAIEKVGKDGVITIEEAKGFKTTLEIVEGMRFNRGFVSPFFVTNSEKLTCELNNPYILVTNKKFESMKELLPILEQVHKERKSILIIADDIDGEALNTLTVNKMKGILDVCAIRAPEFGQTRHDMLGDIAVLTGGQIVSDQTGVSLNDIDLNNKEQCILGKADKIIVGKNDTTIVVKNRKEEVSQRVEELRNQFEEVGLSEDEKNILKRRLSKLVGGVAIVRVGGATEVEMREKKDRVDDALCATQAAVETGIIPGGGVALVHAAKNVEFDVENYSEGFIAGANIILKSCCSPLIQIVKNAGCSAEVVLHAIKESGKKTGWDAVSESYVDMIEKGIIDPLKVPRVSLENASSIASLMLTIECAIINENPLQEFMENTKN